MLKKIFLFIFLLIFSSCASRKDLVYFQFDEIENQNVNKVNIFSMQGKKVLQSEKGKVNIQQLQTGVYLIKIETNEGGQFVSKFIKK